MTPEEFKAEMKVGALLSLFGGVFGGAVIAAFIWGVLMGSWIMVKAGTLPPPTPVCVCASECAP